LRIQRIRILSTACVNNYLDALSVSAFRLVESWVPFILDSHFFVLFNGVAGLVGDLVFSELAGLGVPRLGVVATLFGVFADILKAGAGVPGVPEKLSSYL